MTLEWKTQVVKAPRLAWETIKKMVNKVVIPFLLCLNKVNAINLRPVFRIVKVYFTFCRFDCFAHLEAADFIDNGEEIEINFRRAKNDAKHRGNTLKLVKINTNFCPVFITRFYFSRFGFQFNGTNKDRSK